MTPDGGGSQQPKEVWFKAAVEKLVEGAVKLSGRTMEGASFREKLVTLGVYLLFALGVIGLITPPYNLLWQIIPILLAITGILFLITFGRIWSSPPSHVGDPLRPHVRNINSLLESMRKRAYEILKNEEPLLSDSDVRANIFLPANDPTDPSKSILRIYPGLHRNMELDRELGIEFGPGQGLVGDVFESTEYSDSVARRSSSDNESEWHKKYDITDELANLIHPNLKCIMSMALKGQGDHRIGVLNVDILNYQFENDTLYDCLRELALDLLTMESLMNAIIKT